jgi:hypothetical protein
VDHKHASGIVVGAVAAVFVEMVDWQQTSVPVVGDEQNILKTIQERSETETGATCSALLNPLFTPGTPRLFMSFCSFSESFLNILLAMLRKDIYVRISKVKVCFLRLCFFHRFDATAALCFRVPVLPIGVAANVQDQWGFQRSRTGCQGTLCFMREHFYCDPHNGEDFAIVRITIKMFPHETIMTNKDVVCAVATTKILIGMEEFHFVISSI